MRHISITLLHTSFLLLIYSSILAEIQVAFLQVEGFLTTGHVLNHPTTIGRRKLSLLKSNTNNAWNGEVVSGGQIRGCTIQKIDGSMCEWTIQIDGVEADLGRFSEAIYKKITSDAKKMRFQGFRAGSIPPHLIPTYIAYSMDECAREVTLEAMMQNNIRPFDDARAAFQFDTFSFPRVTVKSGSKKASKGTRTEPLNQNPLTPAWVSCNSMKEAIDAGWKPGQSFSFIARNVKGQQLKDQNVVGSKAIGAGGSLFDLNQVSIGN